MLNTYLTVKLNGKSESHKDLWQDFSRDLIKFIVKKNPSIKWFLWGKKA